MTDSLPKPGGTSPLDAVAVPFTTAGPPIEGVSCSAELQKRSPDKALPPACTALLDELTLGVLITGPRDEVVWINRAFATWFGFDRTPWIGAARAALFEQALRPTLDDPERFLGALERAVADGRRIDRLRGRIREAGARPRRTIEVRSRPLACANGLTGGRLEELTDLTEHESDAERRLAMERRLLEAQKLESLAILSGGIAHDFNNLLVAIMGYASLGLLQIPASSSVQRHLVEIERAAERAADLARQLLAYSGRGRFVIAPVDVSTVVRDITTLLQVSVPKGIVLKYRLATGLPLVHADETQIRQLVTNLVLNAAEAIADQSGIVTVTTGRLRADRPYLSSTLLADEIREGDYVFLEVADTGCGMSTDTRTRMFDPFFTTKRSGRGLGLAAVQGIARGHGGAIKVYTEPGSGTTLKVLLPAAVAEAEGEPEPVAEDGWRGSGTVLVVDDEDTVRAVVRQMLVSLGFEVAQASDGVVALERLRNLGPGIRLVLLDVTMPRMDGEETFREIRLRGFDVKVVLMSGYNETDVMSRFAGKGVAGFLQKPFRVDALRDTLRAALPSPPLPPPSDST